MLTLRPRMLIAAAAASLAIAAPVSAGGPSVPVYDAQANPTTVTAGGTTVITPASEEDRCQALRLLSADVEAAGFEPELFVVYEVNPAGSFDVIDDGEAPVDAEGQWSISIDTTGYAPGDYEVYVECYMDFSAFPAGDGVEAAGDQIQLVAVYNEVPFSVVAATTPPAPPAPTPPPAAQADAVTAAPTFTG